MMSRAYDARQQAITAYPNDKESAIQLFLDFLEIGEEDFEWEFNQTVRSYLYGDERV